MVGRDARLLATAAGAGHQQIEIRRRQVERDAVIPAALRWARDPARSGLENSFRRELRS